MFGHVFFFLILDYTAFTSSNLFKTCRFQHSNPVCLFTRFNQLAFDYLINKALNLSCVLFPSCRACCPEPGPPARDPPAGELPCSRMRRLRGSRSQTRAGDSRPPMSTLTPSHPTPSSSSPLHSRGTGSEHTGMSEFIGFVRNPSCLNL